MLQDTDEEEVIEEHHAFDRGTTLSIFAHDRFEDFGALVAAILIAVVVSSMGG